MFLLLLSLLWLLLLLLLLLQVNGVAVVPLTDTYNLTYLDRMAIDKEVMFLQAYKSYTPAAAAQAATANWDASYDNA
jgi:hypothetical protein